MNPNLISLFKFKELLDNGVIQKLVRLATRAGGIASREGAEAGQRYLEERLDAALDDPRFR